MTRRDRIGAALVTVALVLGLELLRGHADWARARGCTRGSAAAARGRAAGGASGHRSLGGGLAGIAVFAKLPFALPAVALIAASPARAAAARWAAGAIAAQAVACTAVFGTGFWSQIVKAQVQAGEGFEFQLGSWAQAGWNLLPLAVFAVVALWLRGQARERALLLTLGAAAQARWPRRSRSSNREPASTCWCQASRCW